MMAEWSVEYLGWAATAVFVGSYLCRQRAALTRLQIIGALMWVAYGLLIGATPVVAANLLVVGAAAIALSRDAGVAEASSMPRFDASRSNQMRLPLERSQRRREGGE